MSMLIFRLRDILSGLASKVKDMIFQVPIELSEDNSYGMRNTTPKPRAMRTAIFICLGMCVFSAIVRQLVG